ncbi:hypothetical protein ABPG74_016772 [Tetrahymena malaccensis]
MNNKNSFYSNHSLKLRPQQLHRLKELLFPKKNNESLPYQINQNEAKIDLKLLSKELAKILESSQEIIEEELKQIVVRKNITFDEFKNFQEEFIAQLYNNPSHPLDMQVSQLNEIRKDFEEAALRAKDKNSSNEGIPIDGFSQILARKMNLDPSRIQKFLQKSAFFNQITWNEFQSMLDKESRIREELLDWFMHKESPDSLHDQNEYSLVEKNEYDLKPKERTSERIFLIEYFVEMKVDKRNYFLVIFDESTIAIYNGDNFQSALEFVIPQATLKEIDKQMQEDVKDYEKQQKEQNYKMKGQSNFNNRNLQIENQTANNITRYSVRDQHSNLNNSYYNIPVNQTKSTKYQHADYIQSLDDRKAIKTNHSESSNQNFRLNSQNAQKRASSSNKHNKYTMSKMYARNNVNSAVIQEDSRSNLNWSFLDKQNCTNKNTSLNESIYLATNKKQQIRQNDKLKNGNSFIISKQDRSKSMNQSIFTMNSSLIGNRFEGEKRNFQNQSSFLYDSRNDQSYMQSTNYNSLLKGEFKRTTSGIQQQHRRINQSSNNRIHDSTLSINSQSNNPKAKIFKDSNILQGGYIQNTSNDKYKREDRREGSINKNNLFLDENLYQMEEDPDFHLIIKIYLTSDIKDEDDKKRPLSLEQFYEIYKKDPYKYPYINGQVQTPKSEINSKTMSKEQEEYINKDNETKDIIRKLWKKFHQLPREFSLGYARAVNEIIQEKNVKQINLENLKMFFKKSFQVNPSAPSSNKNQYTYLSKTPINQKKRVTSNWRSEQGKKYLQDIKDIDSHININPWDSEYRKKPEHQMPVFLKEIQQQVDQKIVEKQLEKMKNGNKRQNYQSEYQDELGNQDYNQEGNVSSEQTMKNRSNRLKTFSIEFLSDLSLLAMGTINRQLQMYFAYHEKNVIQMKKVFSHQFKDCIICIQFRLNVVTKRWNVALLFENNIFEVYEFSFNVREQKITPFQKYFYKHEFKIEINKMSMFSEFGFVLTSYNGEFFIFSDHLTTKNSSDEVKSLPQYYIDQENKLQENGIALSITAMACCEPYQVIIFGTSKGKIAFYEIKTREFLGIHQAGDDIILNLHIYKSQNQVISICKSTHITVWDVARRTQIQNLRGIDDRLDVGNAKITASHFTYEYNQLFVMADTLKVWEMQVNKNILFKERKMQQLYEWRKKDIEKQDNYLKLEGDKSSQVQTPEKKKLLVLKKTSSIKKQFELKNQPLYIQKDVVLIKQAIITKGVLITWDSDNEIKIMCTKKYKLKYSFMLSAPEDDKIMYLDILDDKILAMCTEKGDIYIKNLYTEDLCQKISEYEGYPLKLNMLIFLPQDCQMFLAASSLEGKVMFFNSYLKKKTSTKYITINAHNKDVITMVTNNYTTMVSAGVDNMINIYSLRSCSSIQKVDFTALASQQYIYQLCMSKEKQKEREKNLVLIILERGQVYELNCNDFTAVSTLKDSVGMQPRCDLDGQNRQLLVVDDDLNLKIYEKQTIEQLLSKHLSLNFSQSPTRFTAGDYHNIPALFNKNNKNFSKPFLQENEKWNNQPSLIYSLKTFPLFAKCKDPEIQCIKILYDESSQHYFIFLNQIAAILISAVNKDYKLRYYFYSSGELSEYQRIIKNEESNQNIDSQSNSNYSMNLI